MRGLGTLAVATFVGLLSYGIAAQSPDRSIDEAIVRGVLADAPELRLPPLSDSGGGALWNRAASDGAVELSELRGAPIVLNFWASWCQPCEVEAPVLRDGWADARARGALVLGLNQQDRRSEAHAFIRRHELSFPHVRDQERDVADDWGVSGLPETFFITSGGKVAAHVVGAIDRSQFEAGLNAAIRGVPGSATRGGAQGGVP